MLTINKNLKGKKVLDSSKFSTITSSIACSITTFTGVMVMNSITPMFCDDLTKYSDNGAGVISYFAGYGAAYGFLPWYWLSYLFSLKKISLSKKSAAEQLELR